MKANTGAFILFAIMATLFVWSCSRQEVNDPETCYNNGAYLEISSYDAPYLLTKSDMQIFDEALKRFRFYEEDQELKYHAASPASINISPRLYDYIISLVEKGNDPLTRSSQPTDCVARSLAWWGDYSYSEINSYIAENYGTGGVPSDSVFDVITHFYPTATQCSPDSLNAGYTPNVMRTLGYYETEEAGIAHMVNIADIDSVNVVTYMDMQNNGAIGSLPLSRFSMIYMRP